MYGEKVLYIELMKYIEVIKREHINEECVMNK